MKQLYLPVYRVPVSYIISYGRRWSVLEHMLLAESTIAKRTALELAQAADLPQRLVIEGLINLLRANWIEVRSDNNRVYFAATPAGIRRTKEKVLPERLQKDIRWDSLCVDRVTAHWMRTDELDLVHEKDLPSDAIRLKPLHHTFSHNESTLRDLFRLNLNESLEPVPPTFRPAAQFFAKVGIAFGDIEAGLPSNAPIELVQALKKEAALVPDDPSTTYSAKVQPTQDICLDNIRQDDLIVGGPEQLEMLRDVFTRARSVVVIHSCFLSAQTVKTLLPHIEQAAKRKVKIDLLWGLNIDPELKEPPRKIADTEAILNTLLPNVRSKVNLSPSSSGSHAKIVVYDDSKTGCWTSIISSCNFLSSDFDWMEVSVRTRSALFTSKTMSRLISRQLPAVGGWSATARRLNSIWSQIKQQVRLKPETGDFTLTMIADRDHYACVTLARDNAKEDIEIACDLYGLSAETSVLVPMETAATSGLRVDLKYSRQSKSMVEEGQIISISSIEARGMHITNSPDWHAKYLGWDKDNLAVTSFNWMATATAEKAGSGAEIGVLIQGPSIRETLNQKLAKYPKQTVDVD